MTTLQITFVSESAGYQNTLGWYNTRTGEAGIIFLDTNDDGANAGVSSGTTATLEVEQSDLDAGFIGFFLIPNGALRYGTGEDSVLNGPLSFDTKGNGDGRILDADGHNLTGAQGEVIFSDPALNKKDADYTQGDDDGSILGQIAFEDLVKKSDGDFNDLVIDVQVVVPNQPPVVEDQAFGVAENSAAGTPVGTVAASDPDAGQSLAYEIVAGNENGAFAIDATTGAITVADPTKLDFEDPALASYALTVKVTDNGTGALSDAAVVSIAVANVVETLQGHALDGYVAGATVFADQDGDGLLDDDEVSATTDAGGGFTLVDGSGPLVMFGGVDVATRLAFTGVLRAPAGATVVTPLTTVVAALVDAGQSPAAASANVAATFGVGPGIDLLNFDPIPAAAAGGPDGDAAVEVLAAGIQVQNAIVQIGALLSGAGATDAHAAVVAALASLAASGVPIDLTDAAVAEALIDAAAAEGGVASEAIGAVTGDAAQVLAATNAAVSEAAAAGSGIAVLEALAQVAAVAQGTALAEALAQAGAANDAGTLVADYSGASLAAKIADAEIGDVDGGTVGTPGDEVLVGTPGNDLIDGLAGNDLLQGLDGNDRLLGGDGDDVLAGGAGNDFMDGGFGIDRVDYSAAGGVVSVDLLFATASDGDGGLDTLFNVEDVTGSDFGDTIAGNFANNVLDGGMGNDVLRGGGGNDTLDGGIVADFQSDAGFRDDDRADYSTAFFGVTVNLDDGVATDGEGGTDSLSGIEGVIGSAFNDHFTGSDIWREVYRGGAGDDTIHGGGGFDIAEYSDAAAGVTISLGRFDGLVDSSAAVVGDPSVGFDTLTDVELFVGSDFDDTYSVAGFSSGAFPNGVFSSFNSFEGRGGDDLVFGNGNTRVEYTSATARVRVDLGAGEASADDGSVGFDRLVGVNQVRGSSFNDELIGTFSNDTLDGRGGNDVIDGREGFDRADYGFNGPAAHGIMVNLAAGIVIGDAEFSGTDELRSIEAIRGTHLADTFNAIGFFGSFGTLNEFEGMAGDDTVVGNGSTRLSFILAREGVSVDLELGKVFGDTSVGTDTVSGVNAMRGSGFDDLFMGTNHGIVSAQVYEGRAGNDEYSGRGGFDQARYDSDPTQTGIDVEMAAINAFTGRVMGEAGVIDTDTLIDIVSVVGTRFADSYDATGYFSDVSTLGAFNEFDGGAGDDSVTGNGATRATFLSSFTGVTVDLAAGTASGFASGNDRLIDVFSVRGSNFIDTLRGSGEADTFEGRGGNDFINGRDGLDLVRYDNGSNAGGTFIADAAGGFSASAGGHDTDTLVNVESIRGTGFNDLFVGTAAALGFVFDGRGGNDILLGSQGDDELLGGDGMDLLRGGLGADRLNGGSGPDRFDFNGLAESGDTVVGFEAFPGGDLLDIADLLLNETGYAGGPLSEFVRIVASGADGLLQINPNGSADPLDWQTLATLLGGAGLDADVLLASGNLDTEAAAGITRFGTDGNDSLLGSPGNDTLIGLLGNDLLQGGAGDDFLDGGIIADLQSDVGFRDTDRVDYGTASSGVSVYLGAGLALDGEGGLDTLIGIESVNGSMHNDTLTGSSAFSENFHGGAGNDVIQGGGGNDRAEYADGTSGVWISIGTAGNSAGTVSGNASVGFDTVVDVEQFVGSEFADTYHAGNFLSASGAGGSLSSFNSFEGRGGNDIITGNGNTRVEYTNAESPVTVDLATGTASDILFSVGTDRFLGGVNQVRGSAHADMLLGGNPLADGFESFDGRGGNDWIDGGTGWDRADYAFNGPITTGITVHLADGTVEGDSVLVGMDTLRGIDAIRGSHRDDTFDATGFSESSSNAGWFGPSNEFEGMAGNDTVLGNGSTTLAFFSAREGVSVDLQAGSVTGGPSVGSDTILGGISGVRGSNFDDTIVGTSGDEFLSGGNSDDLLRGGAGFDFLDGGLGSDRFDFDSPFEGIDTISFFEAFPGGDVLDIGELLRDGTTYDGGTGVPLEDFVRLAPDLATFATELQIDIDGSAGAASWQTVARMFGAEGLNVADLLANGNLDIESEAVGQIVPGDSGNNFLEGGAGNDTLLGFQGNDTLRGRGGDDVLNGGVIADLQSDAGFRDNDQADYSTALSGVVVNLQTGIASDDGEGGTDELIGIEAVTGSAFDDTIVGADDTFSESFHGGAGNDSIDGGGGNDLAEYGDATGPLEIELGALGDSRGEVRGDASVGTDTLVNVERVMGSDFADTFNAFGFASASAPGGFLSRFNAFEGRGGNDVINGNGATRAEYTGAMSGVTVDLELGQAMGDASVGTDTLSGVSQVRASSHNDTLRGSFVDETFDGRGGDDFINGRGGFDRADYAFNGPAAVGLMVNLAAGTVEGAPASGTDTLRSIEAIRGTHRDDVYDARGFSPFSVNAGSFGTLNEFEGMAGNDTVHGNGNTRLSFVNAREGVSVDLAAGAVEGGASVGNDILRGGINQMRGSSFGDTLSGTNHGITSAQVYEGRAGDDTFSGRGGFDQARYDSDPTQSGIEVVMATAAGTNIGTVTGEAGIIDTDTLIDVVAVVGTAFADTYDATGYFSPVSTLGAFNEFEGLGGDDAITGNGSTRVSYISSPSGVTVNLGVTGGALGDFIGSDTLTNVFSVRGSNLDDTLLGSAGDDTFEGRGGFDIIDGGAGSDLVRYDNGSFGGGSFVANALGEVSASASGHDTDILRNIEQVRGTNFDDTFDGSASSAGFTFDGRGGNDLLRGGLGADFMDGGLGSDTFDFDHLGEAGDTVASFEAVPGGDVLDIADLLAFSTGYAGGAGGALSDFVRLETVGPDAQLQIDPDGAAGAAGWSTLATLLERPGLDLNTLIDQGNLDTLL